MMLLNCSRASWLSIIEPCTYSLTGTPGIFLAKISRYCFRSFSGVATQAPENMKSSMSKRERLEWSGKIISIRPSRLLRSLYYQTR